MISQSITLPQALWERLFKSLEVVGTSVPIKVVGMLYL